MRQPRGWSLTNKIIILNVISFIVFEVALIINPNYLDYLALKPANIFGGMMIWTLFTTMFMHANFGHLFVNMISLFFVGNFVEQLIGKRRMLIFYLVSGLVASIFFVLLSLIFKSEYNIYAVGASGAIFALASLLMVLVPRLKVLVFFIIPMPLWLAMLVLLFGLWGVSYGLNLPIGNTAHLGGFVAGIVYGAYLRFKYPRKVEMLNMFLKRSGAFR